MTEYDPHNPEMSEDDKKLIAFINGVGCRLRLRDTWRASKEELVLHHDTASRNAEGFRETVFSFIKSIDMGLGGIEQDFEEDSQTFGRRLMSEESALGKERMDDLIVGMSEVDPQVIGTPDTLLPWAQYQRGVLAETLWDAVQDGKETPEMITKAYVDHKVTWASGYLDQLINGIMSPGK